MNNEEYFTKVDCPLIGNVDGLGNFGEVFNLSLLERLCWDKTGVDLCSLANVSMNGKRPSNDRGGTGSPS